MDSRVVKIVTAAVIRRGDRILLARRGPLSKLAGKWEFPGGKVEESETLAGCLERELKEELGVNVRVGASLCSSEFAYEHGHFRIEAFWVEILSGEITLSVHDRIEWAPSSTLRDYDLLPADLPIADAVAAACE